MQYPLVNLGILASPHNPFKAILFLLLILTDLRLCIAKHDSEAESQASLVKRWQLDDLEISPRLNTDRNTATKDLHFALICVQRKLLASVQPRAEEVYAPCFEGGPHIRFSGNSAGEALDKYIAINGTTLVHIEYGKRSSFMSDGRVPGGTFELSRNRKKLGVIIVETSPMGGFSSNEKSRVKLRRSLGSFSTEDKHQSTKRIAPPTLRARNENDEPLVRLASRQTDPLQPREYFVPLAESLQQLAQRKPSSICPKFIAKCPFRRLGHPFGFELIPDPLNTNSPWTVAQCTSVVWDTARYLWERNRVHETNVWAKIESKTAASQSIAIGRLIAFPPDEWKVIQRRRRSLS